MYQVIVSHPLPEEETATGEQEQAASGGGTPADEQATDESEAPAGEELADGEEVPVDGAEEATEPEVEPEYRTVYVDPGSGSVTGVVNDEEGMTWWLYRGHMYLWQDWGIFNAFNPQEGWCVEPGGGEPSGLKGIVCDVVPQGDEHFHKRADRPRLLATVADQAE